MANYFAELRRAEEYRKTRVGFPDGASMIRCSNEHESEDWWNWCPRDGNKLEPVITYPMCYVDAHFNRYEPHDCTIPVMSS